MPRPRRRWGQHWLASDALAGALVRDIAPHPDDTFLEIGPGTGRLTRALLPHVRALVAVEVDARCCVELHGLGDERLTVIHADILAAAESLPWDRGPFRVVGNLPYNVSSPILRWTVEHRESVVDAHFMLQEEVAERAAAGPGSGDYGLLSVLLAWSYEVRIMRRLSAGAFRPPPQVRSAFVRLTPHPSPASEHWREQARALVSAAFSHRRKQIVGALALSGFEAERVRAACRTSGIDPESRPEDIAPELWLQLAAALPSPPR